MQNAWRSYLELAAGLSEASRQRATEVVRRLSSRSGATVEQLQQVAGDLTETGAMNRDVLVTVVRSELDRALAAVGLAKADEVSRLAERVEELERLIAETGSAAAAGTASPEAAGGTGRTASSAAAGRTGRTASSEAARPASRGAATAGSGTATRSASRTRSSGSTRAPAVAAGHGTGGTASGRSGTTAAAAKRGARSSGASGTKRTVKRSSATPQASEDRQAEHRASGREES